MEKWECITRRLCELNVEIDVGGSRDSQDVWGSGRYYERMRAREILLRLFYGIPKKRQKRDSGSTVDNM